MIGLHASVNWNDGRMKVNLVVKGRAEHPLEHLYTECLREGLRQSLKIAHTKELEMAQKVEDTNIKIELPPLADETPSPVGGSAIEIPFEMPKTEAARPPLFSEFVSGLIEEFAKANNSTAADLVADRARQYMEQLASWHQARAAAGQGDEVR